MDHPCELRPAKVLMRDGKWLVPENERPKVLPPPSDEHMDIDKSEAIGYFTPR